jgi:hypothetical protein
MARRLASTLLDVDAASDELISTFLRPDDR